MICSISSSHCFANFFFATAAALALARFGGIFDLSLRSWGWFPGKRCYDYKWNRMSNYYMTSSITFLHVFHFLKTALVICSLSAIPMKLLEGPMMKLKIRQGSVLEKHTREFYTKTITFFHAVKS